MLNETCTVANARCCFSTSGSGELHSFLLDTQIANKTFGKALIARICQAQLRIDKRYSAASEEFNGIDNISETQNGLHSLVKTGDILLAVLVNAQAGSVAFA